MRARSSRKGQYEHEPQRKDLPETAGTGRSTVILLVLLILIVVGATLFAHWPALSAQALTFDDQQYLIENQRVQNPSWTGAWRFLNEVLEPATVRGYYQPLAMISLMLDCTLGGSPDNLRPFHRTSLILHAANTVLVIVLLYMLFGQPWAAAMVGLLFGVHPMTVEPIAWIGDRKTLLAALFALGCLNCYVQFTRTKRWALYALSLALYVLALMSKPTTTLLPVGLLVMDFWPLRRLGRSALLEKVPFFGFSCVSAVITMISQGRTAGVDMPNASSRVSILLGLCHNIVFYLSKIVWPTKLSSYYPQPDPMALLHPAILAGVVGTAVLVPMLLVSLRWTRALISGWLFFFAVILPTMGGIGFTHVIAADKYAYLPAVGLLLILGWLLERIWSSGPATAATRRRRAAVVAVVLAADCLLGLSTRRHLAHWQTTEGLLDYMLDLAPNAYQLYSDRGNAYAGMHDFNRAIRDYNKAIELKSDFVKAYNNRGIAYNNKGDFGRAIRDYTKAIELKPDYAKAYNNRGNAYDDKGDFTQAIRDYTKAIELKSDYADAYNNRGISYGSMRDHDRAIRDYNRAIELRPDYAEAYYNRGNAYNDLRDFGRAIRDYTKAIELRPDFAEAYSNRGNAYTNKSDFGRAIRDYTKAIELKSDYADAYSNRAIAHFHLMEYDKAWADVRLYKRLGGTPSPELVKMLAEATGQTE